MLWDLPCLFKAFTAAFFAKKKTNEHWQGSQATYKEGCTPKVKTDVYVFLGACTFFGTQRPRVRITSRRFSFI